MRTDLTRLEELWAHAAQFSDGSRPWLFGTYTLADAFYAPVCARIVGYDLPVCANARAYCDTTLNDPAFKAWRAEGLKKVYDPFPYNAELPTHPWPVA